MFRAKYDAWHELGNMNREEAMRNYVENLNKIIETMNFSADVEQFMDVYEEFGPFYEEVEKEDEENVRASNQPNVIKKSSEREPLAVLEENASVNDLIGRYDASDSNLTDDTGDSDFLNGNSSELRDEFITSRRGQSLSELVDVNDDSNHNQLYEELKFAKDSLEEAKSMMSGEEKENKGKLSRQEIERMLGNIDGFISPGNETLTANGVTDDVSELSANEDDEDLFEDSVETISLVEARCPAAPLKARQEELEEEEEEEVLVVTTEHESPDGDDLSSSINLQLQLAVERMKTDLDHLQARMKSVETILVLKENRSGRQDWWPFEDLAPKTVLFMVTWPLISHGLIQLAKVAFRKSRK